MKWEAFSGTRRFVIEHEPLVGFYLFVFENRSDEQCTWDYWQDSLSMAMKQAEDFGVLASDWKRISD